MFSIVLPRDCGDGCAWGKRVSHPDDGSCSIQIEALVSTKDLVKYLDKNRREPTLRPPDVFIVAVNLSQVRIVSLVIKAHHLCVLVRNCGKTGTANGVFNDGIVLNCPDSVIRIVSDLTDRPIHIGPVPVLALVKESEELVIPVGTGDSKLRVVGNLGFTGKTNGSGNPLGR